MTLIDIAHLKEWVGRSEAAKQTVSANCVDALAATLDLPCTLEAGSPLSPLWHWILFAPRTRQSDLGSDGHPKLGGFMPPVPLPRRMWAGGRLNFHDSLRIGDEVERISKIQGVELKHGQSGDLVFVTVRHRITTSRGLAIDEEQDLVYRAANPPGGNLKNGQENSAQAAGAVPLPIAQWRDPIIPDPRLLFRYSAVTFNTHRIHFDLPYAQQEEDYPALVVQGPLTATLLAGRLTAYTRRTLRTFEFRGRSPLFSGAPFHLCGQPGEEVDTFDLWAEGPGGTVAMTARATLGETE